MDIDVVIEGYQDKIFKYCYQMLRNKEDAEEALQEVFLKYYVNAKKDKTVENIGAFLYRIAHNHCINIIRKRKILRFIELDKNLLSEKSEVENNLLNMEIGLTITEALNCLSGKERSLVILRLVEEKSYAEISNILDKKEATLRKEFNRARNKLKEFIVRENGGSGYEEYSKI